jgi:mono/diheme cytochrome c family protein
MKLWHKAGIGVGVVTALPVVAIIGYAGYASATADARLTFADTPYPDVTASTDPAIIERGRYLVHGPAHCTSCHTTEEREHPEKTLTTPLHGGLAFHLGPIGDCYSANLTSDKETGLARWSDKAIARTIKTGVLHDDRLSIMMRLSASELSDDDVLAIVSYLRTLPPEKHEVPVGAWKLLGKMMLPMMTLGPRQVTPKHVDASDEPSLERGEYLSEHVALCIGCHSEYDEATFQLSGPKFGGGMVEGSHGSDDDKEYAPPNLTSDPTGRTGQWTEDRFVARFAEGRLYPSSIMPWEAFGTMSDADLRSIYRYIHSMPPVSHDTGPSYRELGWKPEN